jgi:hypothetical protein
MKYLFQAIEARFNAFPVLKLKGRKLFEGFDTARVNVVKPYTEVNASMVGRLDTFESDVETWELNFRFHAQDLQSGATDDWLDALTDAFKDADVTAGQFQCAGTQMLGAFIPRLTNGVFDATARFRLIFQRRVNLPLVRHN